MTHATPLLHARARGAALWHMRLSRAQATLACGDSPALWHRRLPCTLAQATLACSAVATHRPLSRAGLVECIAGPRGVAGSCPAYRHRGGLAWSCAGEVMWRRGLSASMGWATTSGSSRKSCKRRHDVRKSCQAHDTERGGGGFSGGQDTEQAEDRASTEQDTEQASWRETKTAWGHGRREPCRHGGRRETR